MINITTLIIIATAAWVLQIFLGFFQIRNYNNLISTLSTEGKLIIGKTKNKYKPKTVVTIVLDDDMRIKNAYTFRGITVFARPIICTAIIGQTYPLPLEIKDNLNPNINEAIDCAFS
jgi:glucitol operon activator protein